jgi:zinc finger protein
MPELFNPIGEKVEKVAPTAVPDGATGDEGDEKVVEEIESLCMNCEENVSPADRPKASSSAFACLED